MNSSQQNLLQKLVELGEKIENCHGTIRVAIKQKDWYEKQLLETSRELTNSILYEKVKSEVSSK